MHYGHIYEYNTDLTFILKTDAPTPTRFKHSKKGKNDRTENHRNNADGFCVCEESIYMLSNKNSPAPRARGFHLTFHLTSRERAITNMQQVVRIHAHTFIIYNVSLLITYK